MMTKKDFEEIAQALFPFYEIEGGPESEWDADTPTHILTALCGAFKRLNRDFKEDRFRDAIFYRKPESRKKFQEPTLGACSCRPGVARDNCPTCEGTGRRIDFAAIRAARTPEGR